jgi:serine/threonine protein kinase
MPGKTPLPNSADNLVGHTLPGGCRLVRYLGAARGTAGGFTHSYSAERGGLFRREQVWVKLFDFSGAWRSPGREKVLERMLRSFNFERELLKQCERTSRVVTILDSGTYLPQGASYDESFSFLVLEAAEGDVRDALAGPWRDDAVAKLTALAHLTVGIQQLHRRGAAHQDLKPANALHFGARAGSKVGDLGRATRDGGDLPHDSLMYAGDKSYAPPELVYGAGEELPWRTRRIGCDTYLLGSMVCSLFLGLSMTHLIVTRLPPALRPEAGLIPYKGVLPQIQAVFPGIVEELRVEVQCEAGQEVAGRLAGLVAHLCDPDPLQRGHPGNRRFQHSDPWDLTRVITDLTRLARMAEGERVARSAALRRHAR